VATPRQADSRRPLFTTLGDDIRHVADDVRRHGLRSSLSRTFDDLEAFYLTADDRVHLLAMSSGRRFFRRVGWFAASLLMKLTRTRRVMLALALLLMIAGRFSITTANVELDVNLSLPASLLLLVVLMLELKDKLMARHELEAGRAVQIALMPRRSPNIPGWQVWLYTEPANDVGGDLIDHLQIDDRRHFIVLGDVAGKALPAALLAVKLQATLRALAPNFPNLGDLGSALNRILHRDGLPTRFASLAYLELTAQSGRVRVLNAGHMPPLVVRGRSVTATDRGSMVLGVMPEAAYTEQVIDVASGDAVVIYSDGVTEATNASEEFFGDDRLIASLETSTHLTVDVIGTRVVEALASFVGESARSDDVSLIVLRRM
jgi:hypothetical protein